MCSFSSAEVKIIWNSVLPTSQASKAGYRRDWPVVLGKFAPEMLHITYKKSHNIGSDQHVIIYMY